VLWRTRRAKPQVPWWHPELEQMIIGAKRGKRCIRGTPNPSAETRAPFHSLDKRWCCMIAQAIDDHNACRLAETDHRNVWRTIKQLQAHHRTIPPIDGAPDFQDKCDAFRNTLFPPADAPPPPKLSSGPRLYRGRPPQQIPSGIACRSRPRDCPPELQLCSRPGYDKLRGRTPLSRLSPTRPPSDLHGPLQVVLCAHRHEPHKGLG
jgi:hypothetical protein